LAESYKRLEKEEEYGDINDEKEKGLIAYQLLNLSS
jgi:hypothetical protein